MKRLISWNVNGIRAAEKKGLFDWFAEADADVLCLQETKARKEQLSPHFYEIEGYDVTFQSARKPGYSGVVTYSREKPLESEVLGISEFDDEGRVLISHYKNLSLINCYFPNSQAEGKRLDYKIAFNNAILDKCNELVKTGRNVAVCGDFNVAHKPIDLANPKSNEKNPGYLPEEREWMDKYLSSGYVDTFRMFNKEPEQYTWWSYRMNARQRNVGWRIDYFCINESFRSKIKRADILADVMGSDHCPVLLEADI